MRVEGAAAVFAAGLWLSAGFAAAQDLGPTDLAPPTPRVVIYPGDIIHKRHAVRSAGRDGARRRAVRRDALGG